jgi:hypothetical protein
MHCPAGQGCAPGGTCVPACQAAEAGKTSIGCEYYARSASATSPKPNYCFAAFIANTWDQSVSINVDQGGVPVNVAAIARIPSGGGAAITYAMLPGGELPAGQVAILFLAGTNCPTGVTPVGTYDRAFHITTTSPVVAYDIDPYGGGSSEVTGSSLLIPTSAWDTNYIAVTPRPFTNNLPPPAISIIAAADMTDVTILPVVDITSADIDGVAAPGGPANTPIKYTLNLGQELHFGQMNDLTGSIVQSTHPIGLIGRQGCIDVDGAFCDSAHQQIPPVRALGSEYAAVRYRNRIDFKEESVPWRLVGAVDGTTLTFDPAAPMGAPTTLNRGEIAEFHAPGPFLVKSQDSDHPFYFATYMTGGQAYNGAGDPEFVNVIPTGQYMRQYLFFTDPTYPETNLVIVRKQANDGTFKDVTLDCAGALTGFQPLDSGGKLQWTRTDLVRHNFAKQGNCDNGVHTMTSDASFALTIWGWGTTESTLLSIDVSYAYPAGASIQPINQVVVPPVAK